jgi:lipopolysaccharide transport system ATP-binding protein
VRLAFAVAAHLEPEILIVDEVLAVGDLEFQKKCLGRMGEVAREGRTVLFVSHNMGAISTLCSRALLLDSGRLVAAGPTSDVVGEYITRGLDVSGSVVWSDPDEAPGVEFVKLHAVRVVQRGVATSDVDIDEEVRIEIWFWNFEEGNRLSAAVHLHDKSGVTVFAANSSPSAALADDGWSCRPHPVGLYHAVCTIPGNFLNDGMYRVSAWVLKDSSREQVRAEEVVSFTVHDTGAMRREYTGPWIGAIRPRLSWETERTESEVTVSAADGRS